MWLKNKLWCADEVYDDDLVDKDNINTIKGLFKIPSQLLEYSVNVKTWNCVNVPLNGHTWRDMVLHKNYSWPS